MSDFPSLLHLAQNCHTGKFMHQNLFPPFPLLVCSVMKKKTPTLEGIAPEKVFFLPVFPVVGSKVTQKDPNPHEGMVHPKY
jgi:hypothetical protein